MRAKKTFRSCANTFRIGCSATIALYSKLELMDDFKPLYFRVWIHLHEGINSLHVFKIGVCPDHFLLFCYFNAMRIRSELIVD